LILLDISLNNGIPWPSKIGFTKIQNSSTSPSFKIEFDADGLPKIKIFRGQ
jgi:hypothetical protein